MRHFLPLLFLLFISCQTEQDNDSEKTSLELSESQIVENELKAFIPEGYKLVGDWTADLNLDSIDDKLIEIELDSNIRPLIILIRQKDGTLRQVARNDHAIKWDYCDWNLFAEVEVVQTGSFTISFFKHCYGRPLSEDISFKYSTAQKNWFLNEYSVTIGSNSPSDGGEYPTTKITKTEKEFGQITFEEYQGFD